MASGAKGRTLVGGVLLAAAFASLFLGRLAVAAVVAVVMVLAYNDLRSMLAQWGHTFTFLLGAGGVLGFLWGAYDGTLELLPATGAALVVGLVVSRIVVHELGVRSEGITDDVSATLAAAAMAGVLGAHILLIRSVPRTGFRGLLVFALMVAAAEAGALVAERLSRRHPMRRTTPVSSARVRTWEGAAAGLVASTLTGLAAGMAVGFPFGAASGAAFGAGTGILVPIGGLAFSSLKRGAVAAASGVPRGTTGVIELAGGAMFAAPAFYWAYRTIAL